MKADTCQLCGCVIGVSLDDGGYGEAPALLCDACLAAIMPCIEADKTPQDRACCYAGLAIG